MTKNYDLKYLLDDLPVENFAFTNVSPSDKCSMDKDSCKRSICTSKISNIKFLLKVKHLRFK